MSLRNPTTRVWNRDPVRVLAAVVLLAASAGAAFGVGYSMFGAGPVWTIPVLLTTAIVTMIGGLMILAVRADQDDPSVRLGFPIPGLFLAMGLGCLAHVAVDGDAEGETTGVVAAWMIGAGLAGLLILELVARRVDYVRTLRRRAERHGVTVRGRVVKRWTYYDDHSPASRATVEFTDAEGRSRWIKRSLPGTVSVGSPVWVTYLPDDPGRKAAITVSRYR